MRRKGEERSHSPELGLPLEVDGEVDAQAPFFWHGVDVAREGALACREEVNENLIYLSFNKTDKSAVQVR